MICKGINITDLQGDWWSWFIFNHSCDEWK